MYAYSSEDGSLTYGTRARRYGPTFTHKDRIGLLVDLEDKTLSFFKNDVWLGVAMSFAGMPPPPPPEGGEEEGGPASALDDDDADGRRMALVPGISLCFAGATVLPTLDHAEPKASSIPQQAATH